MQQDHCAIKDTAEKTSFIAHNGMRNDEKLYKRLGIKLLKLNKSLCS